MTLGEKIMIRINKLALAAGAAALSAGLYSTAASAVTIDADAQATVIQPLVVSQTAAMNFGDLSVGATGGTLTLDIGGGLTPSIDIDTAGGTVQVGSYNVTGENGKVYTISFPGPGTLASGGNTMTVSGFTDSAGGTGTVPSSFDVGGTLNVAPNQPAGIYTGTYEIMVNYE